MALLFGTNGADTITGTNNDDVIASGGSNDTVDGGAGDDLILSGSGDDTVDGGDGNDLIHSGDGNDTVDGGAGNDLIYSGNGDDTVDGGDGNDLILTGDGDDDITGGGGSNLIHGGHGYDIANYAEAAQNYSFDFVAGELIVTDLTTGDHDLLVDVELLRFDNAEFVLDGTNNAPIGDDVAADVHEDGPAVAGNLLNESNAFDFEGDALGIVAVNGDTEAVGNEIVLASGALLTVDADGSYSYDPNGAFEGLDTGETGTDTATFDISDGTDTITRTIIFTIEGEDDNVAPVATNVSYILNEDEAGGQYFFDADDADADDDPSTLEYHAQGMQEPPFSIQLPQLTTDFHNDVIGGTFNIVPGLDLQALTEGEVWARDFTYTATDSHGAVSNEATVTVTFIGENDAPSRPGGIGFALFALEDSGIATIAYLVTDLDADDNSASLTYVVQPTTGFTIIDNDDGSYSVDTDDPVFDHLAQGQTLDITFTFDAIDSHGASTTFTNSNMTVTGVNDAPVAAADGLATDEDTPVAGNLFADNGAGQDSDVDDGDTFRVIEIDGVGIADGETVTLNSGALLTVDEDGTFLYDPNGAFDDLDLLETDTDSFTYTIADDFGGMSTALVSIEIFGLPDGGDPPAEPLTADQGIF